MPTDDNTLETLVHKEGDLVKFNGAEFLWHDEWYGPESPHGLPFLDIAKSIDTKFDVGDVEFDYKKLTNGQDEKLNPIYPHLYNGAKNLANMCLGCGHTGVAQALADTIYDFQLPGWLVEINTGIGCGGKLSSQFKAVLSETDEEAREKISDDLLAKIAEEVGTINVTLEKDGRQEDLIPLEKLGLSYLEGLFNANRSHVTHGYSPSKTIGNLIAQPGLVRVIAGGDGDMGAIGLQDFKRAIQYNINALIIPMVNEVFGLTKGQASFSAPNGWQAKRMKSMHKTEPIDFVMEALGMSDSTYVARIISGNRKEMNNHFKAGILHDGTAVVDVASPCVTWNREHGTKFYKDISIDINKFDLAEHKIKVAYNLLVDHFDNGSNNIFTKNKIKKLLEKQNLNSVYKILENEIYTTPTTSGVKGMTVLEKLASKLKIQNNIGQAPIEIERKYEILAGVLDQFGLEKYDPHNKNLALVANNSLSNEHYSAIGLIYVNKDSQSFETKHGLTAKGAIGNQKLEQLGEKQIYQLDDMCK